ncbi:hypothetical protein BGZ93_010110 [Podila epicladia]|nr:hypothetical protein BGZ92_002964 [Podila epicladia]KAG0098855.1 hypothetical protein BGZ93_010110 [Podila epicladia]
MGEIHCHVKKSSPNYNVFVKVDWAVNSQKLELFKSCFLRTYDNECILLTNIKLDRKDKNFQYVASFSNTLIGTRGGQMKLNVFFSSVQIVVPRLRPADLMRHTAGETILENLYSDRDQGDVVFTFDSPIEPLPTGEQSDTTSESSTIQEEEYFDTSDGGQGVLNPCLPKSDDQVKKPLSQATSLKAHKLILTQWPYFNTMFESGFAESEPGEKEIRIKDTKISTFDLLLRFMYTGVLPKRLKPEILYADALQDNRDTSIEDLFLASDRYDVQELRQQTLETLLEGLHVDSAVSFLFRTAYLFEGELREPVVQFVAKSCGPEMSKKKIYGEYKEHPEVLEIVMDLLDAYRALHP